MSDPTFETDISAILRDMAETRLKSGTAGMAGNYSLGQDALELLHRLSSSPDSASDALKLLHELQVHQVEIDLQNEAMQDNGRRLIRELADYRLLYESAPLGYFVVDFSGSVLKVNPAGAELFGITADRLIGTPITRFLAPDSHFSVKSMLAKLSQGASQQSAEVHLAGTDIGTRSLRLMANLSPDRRWALVICHDVP